MNTKDENGRTITIGDKVITESGHIFTIEVIREDDGWVWGSDVMKPYLSSRWYEGTYKNYHNPRYLTLHKKKDCFTHRGSILKFNFR